MQSDRLEVVRFFSQLHISAALGRVDEAYDPLDELVPIHAWPGLIKTLPLFADLRKDLRWSDFCRKVGLPPD